MNMIKKLEEYEKKYLLVNDKDYNRDYYLKYYQDVRDIIADIKYFNEYINRTKINKRFNFALVPNMPGIIYSYFVRDLFFNFIKNSSEYDLLKEDYMMYLLKIYDITRVIYNIIETCLTDIIDKNFKRKYFDSAILDLFEWDKVTTYFTGIKASDYISSFFGCSWMIEDIKTEIERIVKI